MIKVEIKVNQDDIDKIKKSMKKRAESVRKTVRRELPTYLSEIQKTARNIIKSEAFLTGKLYNSITVYWNDSTLSGNVGSDGRIAKNSSGQGYGEFVEFGHFVYPYGNKKIQPKWIPGVYFMTRALAHNKKYRSTIIAKVKDSFAHYDTGGEWFKTETSALVGISSGAALQRAFSPRSQAGRAMAKIRKRTTRAKRSRRVRR